MIRSTATRILLLLVLALAGLMLASLFMLLFIKNSNRAAMLAMVTLQDVLVFIVPAVLAVWIACRKPAHVMGLNVAPSWRALAMVLMVYVASVPMLNYTVHLNEAMKLPESLAWLEQMMRSSEDMAAQVTKNLLESQSVFAMIISVLVVGVLAGLSEEFFFRGAMLGMWRQNGVNPHVGVWVVAIVFSAIHLQFYGFVPRMLIGVWLGYLFVWTRSLWVPVVAHALNNSVVVIAEHFAENKNNTFDLDNLGVPAAGQFPWLAVASAVATVALVLLAHKTLCRTTPPPLTEPMMPAEGNPNTFSIEKEKELD